MRFNLTEEQKNPVQGYEKVCQYRHCKKKYIGKTSRSKYCCSDHRVAEFNEKKREEVEL